MQRRRANLHTHHTYLRAGEAVVGQLGGAGRPDHLQVVVVATAAPAPGPLVALGRAADLLHLRRRLGSDLDVAALRGPLRGLRGSLGAFVLDRLIAV